MMANVTALSVFAGDRLIGTIHDTSPLSFAYAREWLDRSDGYDIVLTVPRQPGRLDTEAVEAFFENLLPEGVLRTLLQQQTQASSTFGLLLAAAGDTAGGLTIMPAGSRPEADRYENVSWGYIAEYFAGGLQSHALAPSNGGRTYLSGAQEKMLISLDDTGQPLLPCGATPSTWIVKPNIRGFDGVWNSAVNEAIVMRAASLCKLNAAEVFFEPVTRACVVKRFDRTTRQDGSVGRLRQYDFCQLTGTGSVKKYEAEGGPGLAKCGALIRELSAQPAVDLRRLCEWVFFNLYTGNNDSHAKNLSLYEASDGGLRLTPFYDLMNTRLYPGLSTRLAMRMGGEEVPGKITRDHLAKMASELGLKPAFVLSVAASVYQRLEPAFEKAIAEIAPALDHSGQALATKLRNHTLSMAQRHAQRFAGEVQLEAGGDEFDDLPLPSATPQPGIESIGGVKP